MDLLTDETKTDKIGLAWFYRFNKNRLVKIEIFEKLIDFEIKIIKNYRLFKDFLVKTKLKN
jgi:hypothetical protein